MLLLQHHRPLFEFLVVNLSKVRAEVLLLLAVITPHTTTTAQRPLHNDRRLHSIRDVQAQSSTNSAIVHLATKMFSWRLPLLYEAVSSLMRFRFHFLLTSVSLQ